MNETLFNRPIKDVGQWKKRKINIIRCQLYYENVRNQRIERERDSDLCRNFNLTVLCNFTSQRSEIIKNRYPFTASFAHSSRRFTPAIRVTMLLLEIMTPFGSPVVPLVYMIVQISVFFFTGRSKCLSFPCVYRQV